MPEKLIFAVLCLSLFACRQSQTKTEVKIQKREVINLIQSYDEAWSKKDTATVASLLAEEYTYFSSRGSTRSRQWMLNQLLGNPDYQIEKVDRSEIAITLYPYTVIVGSRWKGTGSYKGQPVRDDQRCSQVVVKRDNRLFIASEHCTNIET